MNSKRINGIDFGDRIDQLNNSYEQVKQCKEFLALEVGNIRKSIENIQKNAGVNNIDVFYSLKKVVSESDSTILIKCYTISEQMLKHTKYELLNFDETNNSRQQKFLEYQIKPKKFSPNSKIESINNFFKRYDGNKLFVPEAKMYDLMIETRHRYAHRGICDFDLSNVPKIIELLLYLDFEYRMFILNNSWCSFFKYINSIEKKNGDKNTKENNYLEIKKELKKELLELKKLIKNESNIVTNRLDGIFSMIDNDLTYNEVCGEIRKEKDYLKEYFLI